MYTTRLLLFLAVVLFPVIPAAGQSLWQLGKPPETYSDMPRSSIYVRQVQKRPPIEKQDIILIQVVEIASASNDARLESKRELEVELLLNKFVHFSGLDMKPDNSQQPDINVEATRELKARGKTDRNESVRLRIAARVVDVLPNGNLVLEARKQKRINAEVTVVTLVGQARTADVADDYSIPSDRLADMKLAYSGKGPVSSNVVWTWATWLVDHIWPFLKIVLRANSF